MTIVYYGKVESLKKEFDLVKNILDKKYREILDKQKIAQVELIIHETLSEKSYFDDVTIWNQSVGDSLPENTANKLMILSTSRLEITANGAVKEKKISTVPAFYCSEKGFETAGSRQYTTKIIASYVHLYNRFLFYSLQKMPEQIINLYLMNHLKTKADDFNLAKDLKNIKSDKREKMVQEVMLRIYSSTVQNDILMYTQIFDNFILDSIGITVDLPWRKTPRRANTIYIPQLRQPIAYPASGDPFADYTNREVIHRMLNWEIPSQTYPHTFINNFLQSLKRVELRKTSFEQRIAAAKGYN